MTPETTRLPAQPTTDAEAASPPAPVASRDTHADALVRIRPSSGWRAVNLVELWRYRELLWFLALRDVQLRYKQTALGIAWAVIQPLFNALVFTIFFGRLGQLDHLVENYTLFVMVAQVPWQLFSYALTQSSNSLVAEQRLITKVYFPRLIVPVASVLSGLVDFAVAFVLALIAMGWYGQPLTWAILTVPIFVLFALGAALAVGLWLAALNVLYRDVRYTISFLTQLWLMASPVIYPSSAIKNPVYRALYGLNPMAGVIEGFRWAMLGSEAPDWRLMAVSFAMVVLLLVGGLFYFRRLERTFADVV